VIAASIISALTDTPHTTISDIAEKAASSVIVVTSSVLEDTEGV
jgi:hypothetical protein